MAHFAELDDNNKVIFVTVVHNNELLDAGVESEEKGIEFLKHLGENRRWVQTSYNRNFRKNYAGIGDTYDETRDAFIPPQPFESWLLNEETCQWEPPTPPPTDTDLPYTWDEDSLSWIEIKFNN